MAEQVPVLTSNVEHSDRIDAIVIRLGDILIGTGPASSHSTVTLFAKFRGLSMGRPSFAAV